MKNTVPAGKPYTTAKLDKLNQKPMAATDGSVSSTL